MTLTKARRARLERLADYLESLPEDYRHFNMRDYVQSNSADAVKEYVQRNGGVASCGTAACAAGHGPAAGILMPPRFRAEMDGYGLARDHSAWHRYTSLFIGWDCNGRYPNEQLFEWLFSGGWHSIDNHHYGAAARIRYLLAHGRPPSDFDSDYEEDWPAMLDVYDEYRCDRGSKPNGEDANAASSRSDESPGAAEQQSP